MTIKTAKLVRFELPLRYPIPTPFKKLTVREGILLILEDEDGRSGCGEISPFPGLHRETLSEAKRQALQLRDRLLQSEIPEGLERLDGGFGGWLDSLKLFPSVRFGVELAVLNLIAARKNVPLAGLIKKTHRKWISVNALLMGTPDNVVKQARDRVEEGYRSLKIKVGKRTLEEDIRIVRAVRGAGGEKIELRLDANRKWRLEEAVGFGLAAAPFNIGYIEEPLQNPGAIHEFYTRTGIPAALDETLLQQEPEQWLSESGIDAFVLKPSVLGSIEKTMKLAERVEQSGKKVVFSCAFGSGVSLTAAANLAACVNQNDVPAGLDTHRWFKEDALKGSFRVEHGGLFILPERTFYSDDFTIS
ncbi:o-succinylbenzoate synthase [bacterium BMS3Abin05]|nr:o-succinylbenzoate synthase [bacterium BMS3Abin05]GBE27887.1 o-succinylbenzoate synthase [bacterium BMS3Bbin03]HDZ11239.1 o-succinylbenzoate synthase [Bacteroidota bacterium]